MAMWGLVASGCSLVFGTTAISTYIWYEKPCVIINLYLKYALYKAGLQVKYVNVDNYEYSIAERGIPSDVYPSVLMIHGFSSTKESWLPVIEKFPRDIHIIAVDLLGHGNTSNPEDHDNNPENLVLNLHRLTEKIGLTNNRIHIIGHSFGASLAGRYASVYPEEVSLLSMVCPAIVTPIKSALMLQLAVEPDCSNTPLLPNSVESLALLLQEACYVDLKIHKQILVGIMQLKKSTMESQEKLLTRMQIEMNSPKIIENYLEDSKDIKAKIQILWGEDDKVIHMSGIDVLKKCLPQVNHLQTYDRCGHSVHVDRPELLTNSILEFREMFSNYSEITNSKKEK